MWLKSQVRHQMSPRFPIHLELQGHVAISHRARRQHGGHVASVSDGVFRHADSLLWGSVGRTEKLQQQIESVWFLLMLHFSLLSPLVK